MKLSNLFRKRSPFIQIQDNLYIRWDEILRVEPFRGFYFESDGPKRSYVTLTDGRAFSGPRTPIEILEDIHKAARR